ncbi:hypothetical protein FE257_000223 [Aspergillus nanangensis]|uniref:N-acetyltransferase domain-containing protein n=1 Tax=Aspergillus nanangensis TaxID=2582783 RepID=A0AAD4GYW3_ASPNN|nr:hypothetical protein FE257_000223 [Aspergillus nanangensis]
MSAQPPGPQVTSPAAQLPCETTLNGRTVQLVRFNAKHADELYPHVTTASLWQFLTVDPPKDEADFRTRALQLSTSPDPFYFAVIDQRQDKPTTGKAVGYLTLMRIVPEHLCVEIGSILFSPAMQKSVCSTEAVYLLLQYAFETLRYRRVEWKCNSLHEGSRRAALRLGFTFEGIFRQHMVIKGVNRDTAWFAMLREDWDGYLKESLEKWLDGGNFDASGVQQKRLEEIMDDLKG